MLVENKRKSALEFEWASRGVTTHRPLPLSVAKGLTTYTYGQTSVATDLFFLKIFHRP